MALHDSSVLAEVSTKTPPRDVQRRDDPGRREDATLVQEDRMFEGPLVRIDDVWARDTHPC